MGEKVQEYKIKGHQLTCPVCQGTLFWTRKSMLNTRGLTFLGMDWANKAADNYVCDNCGYMMWFLPK
ncbi:MAG: hypothetical protein HPY50_14590 [Firmicutes bacterium]|nr:hypothetical protein [Bacillota bacterium]